MSKNLGVISRNTGKRLGGFALLTFGVFGMMSCATSADDQSANIDKATNTADANTKCKPTFTQVYQPPFKLGGSGRVIMVPNGEKCEKVNIEQALYEKYPSPWLYVEFIAKERNQVLRKLSLDALKKHHPKWSELYDFPTLRLLTPNEHSLVFPHSKECADKSDCAAIQSLIGKRGISCEQVNVSFAQALSIKKDPKDQLSSAHAKRDGYVPVKLDYLNMSSGNFGCVNHYLRRRVDHPESSPTYLYFGEAGLLGGEQKVSFLCYASRRYPRCFFKRGSLSNAINLME